MNKGKAPGSDGLPNEVLYIACPEALLGLFNAFLTEA